MRLEAGAASATPRLCPAISAWCRGRFRAQEQLQVSAGGTKRALGTRRPIVAPDAPNWRWSPNFVSGRLRPWAQGSSVPTRQAGRAVGMDLEQPG